MSCGKASERTLFPRWQAKTGIVNDYITAAKTTRMARLLAS